MKRHRPLAAISRLPTNDGITHLYHPRNGSWAQKRRSPLTRHIRKSVGELLDAGFRPCRRGTFVSAKVPKTISARMRPLWGSSAYAPNKMVRALALLKQPSPRGRFVAPAPPHPKSGYRQNENPHRKNCNFSVLTDRSYPRTLIVQNVSWSPPSPALGATGPPPGILSLWRRLFEWRGGFAPRSEFLSLLIRGGGPGIPENLLLSKVGGVAHRQKWFWFILPKQRDSSRGAKPHINISQPHPEKPMRQGRERESSFNIDSGEMRYLQKDALFYYRTSRPPYCTKNGTKTSAKIAESLIRILSDGPEVSLSGSPTVSPTTAAL